MLRGPRSQEATVRKITVLGPGFWAWLTSAFRALGSPRELGLEVLLKLASPIASYT